MNCFYIGPRICGLCLYKLLDARRWIFRKFSAANVQQNFSELSEAFGNILI